MEDNFMGLTWSTKIVYLYNKTFWESVNWFCLLMFSWIHYFNFVCSILGKTFVEEPSTAQSTKFWCCIGWVLWWLLVILIIRALFEHDAAASCKHTMAAPLPERIIVWVRTFSPKNLQHSSFVFARTWYNWFLVSSSSTMNNKLLSSEKNLRTLLQGVH